MLVINFNRVLEISNEIINFKQDIRIEIVCLHVNLPSIKSSEESYYKVTSYDKDLECISCVLSTEKKEEKSLIYFITTVSKGKFVIPLIHNNSYVERIYLYNEPNDQQKSDWIDKYSKIAGSWPSFEVMEEQLKKDLHSVRMRPSRWARSQKLFIELWTQQFAPSDATLTINMEEKSFESVQIVVLFYDNNDNRFHLSYTGLDCAVFDDIQQCSNAISEREISSIFLLICGAYLDNVESAQSLIDLIDQRSIHAAYIFLNADKQETSETTAIYASFKLSGIFTSHRDLLAQLATDICFYRQLPNIIPKISFMKISSEVLAHLGEDEKEFLRYQLFFDILPQLPSLQYITNVHESSSINVELCQQINKTFKKHDLPKILNSSVRVPRSDKDIQSLTKVKLSLSTMVYRAQLISDMDLERIRQNPNALFSIFSPMIVSKSHPTVIDICRRAIQNGLTTVLFEIKLLPGTSVYRSSPDGDILGFPLGAILQLKSVEQTPDAIWHVQAVWNENNIEHFKDQLQFKTDKELSLETIAKYWADLDPFGTNNDSDE